MPKVQPLGGQGRATSTKEKRDLGRGRGVDGLRGTEVEKWGREREGAGEVIVWGNGMMSSCLPGWSASIAWCFLLRRKQTGLLLWRREVFPS